MLHRNLTLEPPIDNRQNPYSLHITHRNVLVQPTPQQQRLQLPLQTAHRQAPDGIGQLKPYPLHAQRFILTGDNIERLLLFSYRLETKRHRYITGRPEHMMFPDLQAGRTAIPVFTAAFTSQQVHPFFSVASQRNPIAFHAASHDREHRRRIGQFHPSHIKCLPFFTPRVGYARKHTKAAHQIIPRQISSYQQMYFVIKANIRKFT